MESRFDQTLFKRPVVVHLPCRRCVLGLSLHRRILEAVFGVPGEVDGGETEGMTAEQAFEALARTTDILNSWARESGLIEANTMADTPRLADNLWAYWSHKYYDLYQKAELNEIHRI